MKKRSVYVPNVFDFAKVLRSYRTISITFSGLAYASYTSESGISLIKRWMHSPSMPASEITVMLDIFLKRFGKGMESVTMISVNGAFFKTS